VTQNHGKSRVVIQQQLWVFGAQRSPTPLPEKWPSCPDVDATIKNFAGDAAHQAFALMVLAAD